jgi:plastocyanin
MKRLVLLAAVASLTAAPTAHAATRTISIGAAFTPSVVVVTPGTTVVWRNDDSREHTITGDLNSSTLAPGASTAPRVLTRLREYHYELADNGNVNGTIVVARKAARRPAKAVGTATGTLRGTATLTVNERYTFYDGEWRSISGACNAEVGNGTRTLAMRINLNKVKYFRGRGHESLSQRSAPVTFLRYAELVSGQTTTSASREVTCQDGTSTDQTADQSVNCFRDHAGARARALFAWAGDGNGRFEFVVRRPAIRRCGTTYAGILDVLGVPRFGLPLNLGDRGFTFDTIATTPATGIEVRAIRARHRIHVVRRINLQFTTGCCDAYAPQGEADTRVGTVHNVTARLDINLRPR